jgi:hypothetical protein
MEEPPEEQQQQDEAIPPGGDPDAGMPAEEAEIHGIERHPVPQTQQSHSYTNEQGPPTNVDSNVEGDPPVSNDFPEDQPPRPQSPSEQEQRTSSTKQGQPSLNDSLDNIHEDVAPAPVDNNNETNKNDTSTSIPDSA